MAEGRLVYSTDGGDRRGAGERRLPQRPTPSGRPGVPDDGIVRIFRDRGGRGGKVVTSIVGLPGDLKAVASDLKRLCGSGGAVKDGVVEIQGDHREKVAARLKAKGYQVKLAGG